MPFSRSLAIVTASSGSHTQRVTECPFSTRSLARVVPQAPAPTTPIRSIDRHLPALWPPTNEKQPGKTEERCRYEGEADDLGRPEGPQHQAINPEPLDEESTEGVEPKVAERESARKLFQAAAEQKIEDAEDREIPDRLVEKRGMEEFEGRQLGRPVVGFDVEFPRQICRGPEGLLIEKVSPPTDRLPQHKGRSHDVHVGQGRELLPNAIDDRGQGTTQNATVYRQTALPDRQDLGRPRSVVAPVEQDVIETGPYQGRHHAQNDDVEELIRVFPTLDRLAVSQGGPQQDGCGDEQAVPADGKRADLQGDRARRREHSNLGARWGQTIQGLKADAHSSQKSSEVKANRAARSPRSAPEASLRIEAVPRKPEGPRERMLEESLLIIGWSQRPSRRRSGSRTECAGHLWRGHGGPRPGSSPADHPRSRPPSLPLSRRGTRSWSTRRHCPPCRSSRRDSPLAGSSRPRWCPPPDTRHWHTPAATDSPRESSDRPCPWPLSLTRLRSAGDSAALPARSSSGCRREHRRG